jgi:flagellar biosynthesis/type III secretory pathway chaperone
MNNDYTPDNFLKLLNHEIQLANALVEAMRLEQSALETTQPEQLGQINDQKIAIVDKLEQASKKRSQFLLAVSRAVTQSERLQQFIDGQSAATREQLENHLDQLEQQLTLCKEQNLINGKIIAMSQRRVARNLSILKGVDKNSVTYNPKGEQISNPASSSGIKV